MNKKEKEGKGNMRHVVFILWYLKFVVALLLSASQRGIKRAVEGRATTTRGGR